MKPVLTFLTICFLAATIVSCEEEKQPYDAVAQFNADVKTIDEHLASSGQTAIKDPSGVRLVLSKIGTSGLPPKRNHTVKVKFKGSLLSGETIEEGQSENVMQNFFAGVVEGLEILPEGSIAKLFIPSVLAFGPDGRSGVPPNSIVVYDVELMDVTIPQTELTQFQTDTTAIRKYLTDNNIAVVNGINGIKYVINEAGSGMIPGWYSKVRVHYEATVLNTAEPFYIGTVGPTDNFPSRIVDFLPGLQIAFQSFPPGTKATVYIPSTLAFGPDILGNGKVPANSNVVYEITSLEVIE